MPSLKSAKLFVASEQRHQRRNGIYLFQIAYCSVAAHDPWLGNLALRLGPHNCHN
jgi:hypothetical protein